MLGLELSRNPFQTHPSYRAIAQLPLAERLARLRQPEVRAAILSETPTATDDPLFFRPNYDKMYLLGDPRITSSRRKMRWARRPAAQGGSRKNWPMTRC